MDMPLTFSTDTAGQAEALRWFRFFKSTKCRCPNCGWAGTRGETRYEASALGKCPECLHRPLDSIGDN